MSPAVVMEPKCLSRLPRQRAPCPSRLRRVSGVRRIAVHRRHLIVAVTRQSPPSGWLRCPMCHMRRKAQVPHICQASSSSGSTVFADAYTDEYVVSGEIVEGERESLERIFRSSLAVDPSSAEAASLEALIGDVDRLSQAADQAMMDAVEISSILGQSERVARALEPALRSSPASRQERARSRAANRRAIITPSIYMS
jgi:hypothetical protein